MDATARVSACLSILGALFVVISFTRHKPLQKPINRLVVVMSIANIPSCLAYSWGRYAIDAGAESALCQAQAFLIMWLVMTDPILVFLMSLNVYLLTWKRRRPQPLNALEVLSVSMAFIFPLIIASILLALRPNEKRIYGEATMWCWISDDFKILRLALFYIPIWSIISISVVLFIASGTTIYSVRSAVIKATRHRGGHNLPFHHPEVQASCYQRSLFQKLEATSVHIELQTREENSTIPGPLAPLRLTAVSQENANNGTAATDQRSYSLSMNTFPCWRRESKPDSVIWAYSKFAILYALVLIITWVPVSINRVYNGFIAPHHPSYSLYLASAICIPLHGFGNFIIYVAASWKECRDWMRGQKAAQRQ